MFYFTYIFFFQILVLNEIEEDNIEENVEEVFKTKYATLTHETAISIINR